MTFEEKHKKEINELVSLNAQLKTLECKIECLKTIIEVYMLCENTTSVKTDYLTITSTKGSVDYSITDELLEKGDKDCYKGLLNDYPLMRITIDWDMFKENEPDEYQNILETFGTKKEIKSSVLFSFKGI